MVAKRTQALRYMPAGEGWWSTSHRTPGRSPNIKFEESKKKKKESKVSGGFVVNALRLPCKQVT